MAHLELVGVIAILLTSIFGLVQDSASQFVGSATETTVGPDFCTIDNDCVPSQTLTNECTYEEGYTGCLNKDAHSKKLRDDSNICIDQGMNPPQYDRPEFNVQCECVRNKCVLSS